MRYFLQFPSQSEVSYTIIPEVIQLFNTQIEKLEVNDHKDKEYVEVEAFEKYFINNSNYLTLNSTKKQYIPCSRSQSPTRSLQTNRYRQEGLCRFTYFREYPQEFQGHI